MTSFSLKGVGRFFPSFPTLPGRRRGFSLVELTLALGVLSFALIPLLSLLPLSLDSARESMEISRTSKAFQQVSSELYQCKFDTLTALTQKKWQFDREGLPAKSANDVYFTVEIQAAANACLPGNAVASPGLLQIKLVASTAHQSGLGFATITVCDKGY